MYIVQILLVASSFRFSDTVYSMIQERVSGVHVFPGSAETFTLVKRGGMTITIS